MSSVSSIKHSPNFVAAHGQKQGKVGIIGKVGEHHMGKMRGLQKVSREADSEPNVDATGEAC